MRQIAKNGFPAAISSVSDIIAIAVDVGQELMRKQDLVVSVYRGQTSASEDVWVKTKPDGSSLTSSDLWAQDVLVQKLGQLPQDRMLTGIISEEAEVAYNLAQTSKPLLWIIDPLDNTGDYKRGQKNWSVTIGFLQNGKPTGGVVYYPAQQRLYFTGDDGFAYFKHGNAPAIRLHSPAVSATATAKAITDDDVLTSFTALAANNMHASHTDRYWAILISQAAATKAGVIGGAHVAEHGDLFYAWDVAGPAAIAKRAGAIYARRNGQPLNFLEADPEHAPFELPRGGFIAGNRQGLKKLGLT